MTFEPIGYFHSRATYRYEMARQGVFNPDATGLLELLPGKNFEQALRDLDGFERVWLIFVFDKNGANWRPTTAPPIPPVGQSRVGLFASRSPYRPNPIGLSCVRLVGIRGRTLELAETDLLDGTPVLDIKPYIPAADSFPNAKAGWVERQESALFSVNATEDFREQSRRLCELGGPDLWQIASLQLSRDPTDYAKKRVKSTIDPAVWIFSVRMFRIYFRIDDSAITLLRVASGYTAEELADPADKYLDKHIHRALFTAQS